MSVRSKVIQTCFCLALLSFIVAMVGTGVEQGAGYIDVGEEIIKDGLIGTVAFLTLAMIVVTVGIWLE